MPFCTPAHVHYFIYKSKCSFIIQQFTNDSSLFLLSLLPFLCRVDVDRLGELGELDLGQAVSLSQGERQKVGHTQALLTLGFTVHLGQ